MLASQLNIIHEGKKNQIGYLVNWLIKGVLWWLPICSLVPNSCFQFSYFVSLNMCSFISKLPLSFCYSFSWKINFASLNCTCHTWHVILVTYYWEDYMICYKTNIWLNCRHLCFSLYYFLNCIFVIIMEFVNKYGIENFWSN